MQLRVANGELRQQMLPFIRNLRSRRRNWGDRTYRANLAGIKRVAARTCLGVNCRKVGIDRESRLPMLAKTRELRMVAIALSLSTQYCAGQQSLPPERNQSLRIEITRVYCPETHDAFWQQGDLRVPACLDVFLCHLWQVVRDVVPGSLEFDVDVFVRPDEGIVVESARWYLEQRLLSL